MTSMGFQVNIEECRGHKEKQISFFGKPVCCCDTNPKEPESKNNSCRDITCFVQGNNQILDNINPAKEQSSETVKAAPVNREYARIIRPVLQEKIPHFTLPPPLSGRFIGILHQKLII
jgi:hypothetical protein